MKTLGQIACEGCGGFWDLSGQAITQELWEAAAQAVRTAVIEKMIEPDADLLRVIKSAMDPATTSARHVWRMAMLEIVSRK